MMGPRETVVISTRFNGKDSFMLCDWWTQCSYEPEMYLFCVRKDRRTNERIKERKEFTVAFIELDSLEKYLIACRDTKCDMRFKKYGIQAKESEKISCPFPRDCLSTMECKLESVYPSGTHDIFVASVSYKWNFGESNRRPYHVKVNEFMTLNEKEEKIWKMI